VHGIELGDAPVAASVAPFAVSESTFLIQAGTWRRTFEQTVRRSELDVEQDWWSSGNGGETQPIAEWIDHLAADIDLRFAGRLIDQGTTPIVTGSWGRLARADEIRPDLIHSSSPTPHRTWERARWSNR